MTTDALCLLPRTALPDEVLRVALESLERGDSVAVATVIARHGSAPATPGQKLVVAKRVDGELIAVGTVGGGAIERVVMNALFATLDDTSAQPQVSSFRLGPSLGMCCGGSADVLIEPMRPSLAVLVVGAGHVGLATARLLAESGFRVVLADARDAAAEQARIENVRAAGVRVLTTDHDDPGVLAALCARPEEAALLVMTHDHQLDQAVVEWAIARRFSYVGGVGSRAKAERTKKRLEAKGVPQTDVARLRMPVGVDIGARRPVEIAIAIVAELIAFRSRREGAARRGHPEHARIDEVSDPSQSEVPSDGAEDERDSDAAE